jgi:hypothetical protein
VVDGGLANCGAVEAMEVVWPSGAALRGEASNRPQVHWLKTVVLNVVGKGAARPRQVWVGKMSDGRKSSAVDVSKGGETMSKPGVASLSWDEPGGYPFTARAASGIQAA